MSDRESIKKQFLAKQNLADARVEKLPADASFRSYDRLHHGDKTYIVMDAPPQSENVKPYIKVAEYLEKNGFSAPKIIAADEKNGFVLLEDLGDNSFTKKLENSSVEIERELYRSALDVLLELQKSPVPDGLIPYYDDEMLIEEAMMLIDWYIPILNGEVVSKKLKDEYEIIWRHLLQYSRYIPETIVLRDYHADNLMWLEDRAGVKKTGLLDFQDAVIGSPIYDVVSLLEDARRDVSDEVTQEMINYYLSSRTDITRKDFLAAYSILGAQRNLKIIGVFARKASRDRNSNYLKFLPRVWGHIEKDLKHPLLFPLKSWLDRVISPQVRKPSSLKTGEKIIA